MWRSPAVAVLGLGFHAMGPTAAAEDPAKEPDWQRAVPRTLIQPHFKEAAELRWRNGESLTGELSGMEGGRMIWKSGLFQSPLRLEAGRLERIDFVSPLARRESLFRVVLTDGSHLCGTPEKADGGSLFLQTVHCGLVELPQDRIVAMERIDGPDLIAAGPQAFLRGTSTSGTDVDAVVPWFFTAAGQVASPAFGKGIRLPLRLPDKSAVELTLHGDRTPAFSLTLAADGASMAVETWGDELVLTDGESFASAGRIFEDGAQRAHLRLTWDRPAGRSMLYSREGKVLAELVVEPVAKATPVQRKTKAKLGGVVGALGRLFGVGGETAAAQPNPAVPERGVTFQNKGPGVVLEQFQAATWSGQPLPALLPGGAGIETLEKSVPGALTALTSSTVTLRQPDGSNVEFPLETVRAVRWGRTPQLERDPTLTELWFADGDLLRGRLAAVKDGLATMETPAARAPVTAKVASGRALILPDPDRNAEPEPLRATLDQLTSGPVMLHGKIVPEGEGKVPRFHPVGAAEAVMPVPSPGLVLTWTPPAGHVPARAPALLHVKSQESLPVLPTGLESGAIQLAWETASPRALDPALIHAVQFASPQVAEGGFDGPGWQFLSAGKDAAKREGGVITLNPGTGVGHAYMLQGSEVAFRMSMVSGNASSIRVKLFSRGADRTSAGMNFLIADYGSSVYAGVERTEGQISNQRDVPSAGETAEIRFSFKADDMVELTVNGVPMGSSKLDKQGRRNSGNGIIIETASLWGNQVQAVKLSDFACKTSPFMAAPPAFAEEAKREALLLPRLRRDDPPKQVLIGRNGDLLRGEIEAITSTHLGFRSGLEHFKVPMDRVAAAVWVKKPVAPDKEKKPAQEAPAPPAEAGLQWLDLTNGGRLALRVESWNAKEVAGTHPTLGALHIPLDLLTGFRMEAPPVSIGQAALAGWTLETTPDPVLPEAGGGDSALAGKAAEDFKLPLLEGGDFVLKAQSGKVVVLDFWATWCGPCVKSLPGLVEAMAGFAADEVTFLAVNQGETPEQVKRFLEARHLAMPVAMDADQAVARKYAVEGIPHTVVIGPDKKVAFVKVGFSAEGTKEIAAAVTKALAAKPAEPPAGTAPAEAPPASSPPKPPEE
jgi:peroxiredoxin